jgi:hypothetical protein
MAKAGIKIRHNHQEQGLTSRESRTRISHSGYSLYKSGRFAVADSGKPVWDGFSIFTRRWETNSTDTAKYGVDAVPPSKPPQDKYLGPNGQYLGETVGMEEVPAKPNASSTMEETLREQV